MMLHEMFKIVQAVQETIREISEMSSMMFATFPDISG